MGKRASAKVAAPKAEVAAKKPKVTAAEVPPAFTSVSDAIMEAEHLPERVRTMLVDMMPFSLKFAADERHELQSMAVDMVEQTLSSKKSTLEAAVVTANGELAALKASESQLGTAVTDAEAALAEQKAVVEAKKNALTEATEAEKASATNLAGKRDEQKSAQDNLATMQTEKASIEAAFGEHFGALEEGEAKAALKKLEPFLKKIDIESTLLTALPSCVAKAKDKRGTFDQLVLVELDKSFKAKIAALGDSVAAAGPAAIEHEAAVQAAEKDHDAKKAAQEAATAENEAAEKELTDREAALSDAKKAVEDFQPKLEAMTGQLAKAQEVSAEFEAGPYTNFCTYKEKRSALPVEETPADDAPAEAAPAEEATEAAA